MFEQCPACAWRMRNRCACGLWSLISDRAVRYAKPKDGVGYFALRCLHCGRHNPIDGDVARVVILPEVLDAVKRRWEWEHPNV